MTSLSERQFHLVMAVLLVAACFFDDRVAAAELPWNPPRVGFVTLALAMVWLGRYCAWRTERAADRDRVQDDRIDRLDRRVRALEDELRERRHPPR